MAGLVRRPRLLFLCQTLPYPPDGGVWIRTYHVLRLLARAFDVTALCFERPPMDGNDAATDVEASQAALSKFGRVEIFPIPQRTSRIRFAWDHIRSVARQQVYTTFLYESPRFQQRMTDLLATPFDLVHADSLDLVRYLPACGDVPIVCVHHDVESDLLERRASICGSRWRAFYLRHQATLMLKVEREWCRRVAMNVTVSDRDRMRLKAVVPDARVTVVPNGVDTDEFQPDTASGGGVAFIGGTSWAPNLDALNFFCEQILPHLPAAIRKSHSVRWIGNATREQQYRYAARYGVELSGYVRDVRPSMREADCHIVPLRAGGGTRLKILNSWAMGKPVVSTSIGCEGLAAVDGQNILIRDDPEQFARAIVDVLQDPALRVRLSEHGRRTAEELYSWDIIGRAMIQTYLSVTSTGAAAHRSALPALTEPRFGH